MQLAPLASLTLNHAQLVIIASLTLGTTFSRREHVHARLATLGVEAQASSLTAPTIPDWPTLPSSWTPTTTELPRKVTLGRVTVVDQGTVVAHQATDRATDRATERAAMALEPLAPRAALPFPRVPLCVATSRLLALASVTLTAQPKVIAASTTRSSVAF